MRLFGETVPIDARMRVLKSALLKSCELESLDPINEALRAWWKSQGNPDAHM